MSQIGPSQAKRLVAASARPVADSNVGLAPNNLITRDVTSKLSKQGIRFMNVHNKNGCAGW